MGLLNIKRKPTKYRVPSFSGRIRMKTTGHPLWEGIREPVFQAWWPPQFDVQDDSVKILATYQEALPDSFTSDLNTGDISSAQAWEELERIYGINLDPGRLVNDPAVLEGAYGKGKVILSLVHFDTPNDENGRQVLINLWSRCCSDTLHETRSHLRKRRAVPQAALHPLVETCEAAVQGLIDLGIRPLNLLNDAADTCFARGDHSILQYGAEQGNGPFRESLADFLTRGYNILIKPESLFITHGASGALDLTCTLFPHPGDTIFVEEPFYFLALRIFRDHDLRILPIPTHADGLIGGAVAEKVSTARPKFIYTIPTFQNPSGQTLSAERRVRLVELARKHNFLIVADEVYHFLDYHAQAAYAICRVCRGWERDRC